MTKDLLFKALLFIAESRDLTNPPFSQSFHSDASKSESPPSEWSSDSSDSTPISAQRTPRAYPTMPNASATFSSDDNSLSSSSEWESLQSNESDARISVDRHSQEERHLRGRSLSTGCSPVKGWGDTTFAPWLENENVEDQATKRERSKQPTAAPSTCPSTDACPICVRPMSCMETLFAPSCGYLCHLSCMQRTLRNNLDNDRGNRPLDIHSMRCPICFALHPLTHGAQFSHVRHGDRFAPGKTPPGREGSPAGSPNFVPGEFRRVLQPMKAEHTRGYASEADGVRNPKRSGAESAASQLRKTKSADVGTLLDEAGSPPSRFRPGPKTKPPPSPLACTVKFSKPTLPPSKPPLGSAKGLLARTRADLAGFPVQICARGMSPFGEGVTIYNGEKRAVEQPQYRISLRP